MQTSPHQTKSYHCAGPIVPEPDKITPDGRLALDALSRLYWAAFNLFADPFVEMAAMDRDQCDARIVHGDSIRRAASQYVADEAMRVSMIVGGDSPQ